MSITDNLEKMLASGQDSAMLRFGLGSAYFNQKNYSSAVKHLQSCIEQDCNYSAAYKLLGRSHLALDNPVEAEETLTKGMEIAQRTGDKQTEKEISVFLKRLKK